MNTNKLFNRAEYYLKISFGCILYNTEKKNILKAFFNSLILVNAFKEYLAGSITEDIKKISEIFKFYSFDRESSIENTYIVADEILRVVLKRYRSLGEKVLVSKILEFINKPSTLNSKESLKEIILTLDDMKEEEINALYDYMSNEYKKISLDKASSLEEAINNFDLISYLLVLDASFLISTIKYYLKNSGIEIEGKELEELIKEYVQLVLKEEDKILRKKET